MISYRKATMQFIKRLFFIFFLLLTSLSFVALAKEDHFSLSQNIYAQEVSDTVIEESTQSAEVKTESIDIFLFYTKTCPHCAEEKPFLGFLAKEYPQVNVYSYEVGNRENADIYARVAEKLGFQAGPVPFTLVADASILGYGDIDSHGLPMQYKIEKCLTQELCENALDGFFSEAELQSGREDFENILESENEEIIALQVKYSDSYSQDDESGLPAGEAGIMNHESEVSTSISVPFIGKMDAKELSLPVLAVVIGFLDGFNPCAMWTLLFLISLLLGMKDKKRMWLLGIAFIIASGFVYFLFMTAWLNIFLFLGMVSWVRLGIALLALGVGGYHIYDYYKYKDVCHVTSNEDRQKTFERLKKITKQQSLLIALGGMILLAFAVNLVELMCSAGFPAIFTHVLSLSDLPMWKYYMYIFIYLVLFMIDDIIVFGVAMITLESHLVGDKYAKYSKIVGGVLMLIIGLMLMFKPELLMFG